jgi:hypothetical protein
MITPESSVDHEILVVRWISDDDKHDEIAAIRSDVGQDKKRRMVRAHYKKEIGEAVTSWLTSPSARILYIGAHGNSNGLVDRENGSLELLTWKELGESLASVPSAFSHLVTLVLGGCSSSSAISVWMKEGLRLPVSHVVCIEDDAFSEDVVSMIVQLLADDKQEARLLKSKEKLITYLDEGIGKLHGNLPSALKLRLFLRNDPEEVGGSLFAEITNLGDPLKFQEDLAGRTNKAAASRLGADILESIFEPVHTPRELEQKRERAKTLNIQALQAHEDRLPSRPLPGRDVREKKSKVKANPPAE